MSQQAFVLTRNNHADSVKNKGMYERFLAILPSCGFALTTGAIHPPRSVLKSTHIFFIDADYCNPQAMLNLPVVNDYPDLNKVIFNAPEDNIDFHFDALQKGINGIFHTEDSLELIVRGVQQVQAGNKWFSRAIMSRYIDANLAAKTKTVSPLQVTASVLTKREMAITRKIAEGAQNQEIADNFHISVNTVKTHVYSIFRKTDCRNRVELIKWFDNQFTQSQSVNY
jgi:DNA-binding NarL/FixJ family response regulator